MKQNNIPTWRATACGALLMAVVAGCSNELENPTQAPETGGEKVTLIANLPGADAQTRISFEDPEVGEVKLTWNKGDQFLAYSLIVEGVEPTTGLFTLAGDGGSPSGSFIGKSPVAPGETIALFSPSGSLVKDPDNDGLLTATTIGQTQTGNGSTAHLSDYNFMTGSTKDLTQPITFRHSSMLMRFDATLEGYDAATDGAPVKLTLAFDREPNPLQGEAQFSHAVRIGGTASSCGKPLSADLLLKDVTLGSDNKLRAYLMVLNAGTFRMPTDNHFVVSVTCAGGAVYQYHAPAPSARMNYDPGMRYRAVCPMTKVATNPDLVMDNDTQASASFSGGGASADDPYLINNAADLKKMADECFNEMGYKGKFFQLNADISVTTDEWKPIGNLNRAFQGMFDGKDHTISGKLAGGGEYFGFFGQIGYDAEVRNLHITASVSNSYVPELGSNKNQRTGALVGGINNGGKIIGCTNSGTVSAAGSVVESYSFTGGIVGEILGGSIENCTNRGKVIGQFNNLTKQGYGSDTPSAGGIAGKSIGTLTLLNCRNYGDVTADENGTYKKFYLGGIVGVTNSGVNCSFTDCTNYGTLKAVTNDVDGSSGGLIGHLYVQDNNKGAFAMHNCINRGTVEAAPTIIQRKNGGLVGIVGFSGGTIIEGVTCVIADCCADLRSGLPYLVGESYYKTALDVCTEGHVHRDSDKPFLPK